MHVALIVLLVILAIPLILLIIGALCLGGIRFGVAYGAGCVIDLFRSYDVPKTGSFCERFQQLYRRLPEACRCVVVSDLADFPFPALGPFLMDKFRKEPEKNLRLALSSTLASWGIFTDETRSFLESVAYSEDPDELGDGTAKALGALLKLGDEKALEELKELRGMNEIEQRLVYEPLVDYGHEESSARLEESLPAAGEEDWWEVPPLVLARAGRQEAIPAILELIGSEYKWLTAAAARVLWRFPDEATVDLLKSLRRDGDGTVRRRACQSLAHIADSPVRRGDLLIESWAARGNLRWFQSHRRPFSG